MIVNDLLLLYKKDEIPYLIGYLTYVGSTGYSKNTVIQLWQSYIVIS